MASRAEEGRSTTAKSLGEPSSRLNRGYPNRETDGGETAVPTAEHIRLWAVSGGTETSHYPEERKATAIPLVAVSERGTAQTCGA